MATIKDVAKEAGVSVASVSRYMNKKGYVGDDAMRRIQAAIDKLDYRPNEIARSLFQKKTNMIGLIIPDISNPYFPMLARGVEDYLVERNYQMVLGNTANDPTREKQYYQSFKQHNFAGIISGIEPENNFDMQIPLIQVDRANRTSPFYVRSDHQLGGQLVAETILGTDAKNVLIMKGPHHFDNVLTKHQEIEKQFEHSSLKYTVVEVDTFGLENIYQLVTTIFEQVITGNFDTIVATNDIHAIYLVKEGISRGIRIPEELQIIGYDGIDFAELMVPQLSTISQSVYEMGSLAAEMLINKIEGNENQAEQVNLPVRFNAGQTLRKRLDK